MKNEWRTPRWVASGLLAAVIWAMPVSGTVLAASGASDQAVTLYVDGELSELAARKMDNGAYLTLETVATLGGTTTADRDGETYTISAGRKEVRFTVGEKTRFVDGAPVAGEETAVKAGSRVYVPVQWVAGTLDLKVVNDRFTSSLYLFRKQSGVASKPVELPSAQMPDNSTAPSAALPTPSQASLSTPPSGAPVTVTNAQPTLIGVAIDEDTLTIATTGEVSPNLFQLKSPDRIVVDLPDATVERAADGSASGSVAVDPNHPYISGIRYSLFDVEPSTVRIVVDLKQSKPYVFHSAPNGAGVILRFTEMEPVKVMIDAGHGGNDPGAISKSGKFEKDVTLPIAQKVMDRLRQETFIQPIMVREDDMYLSPADRAKVANVSGSDLFISIHANTADSSAVRGTETYYWREDSLDFARTIHEALVQTLGSTDRKVKQERFVVVRETTMPAVLLELGFLTNADDEAKLYNEQMQNRIADTIVKSIKNYYSMP